MTPIVLSKVPRLSDVTRSFLMIFDLSILLPVFFVYYIDPDIWKFWSQKGRRSDYDYKRGSATTLWFSPLYVRLTFEVPFDLEMFGLLDNNEVVITSGLHNLKNVLSTTPLHAQ